MAEFSLDHLTDVVEAMNKLGWGAGGVGSGRACVRVVGRCTPCVQAWLSHGCVCGLPREACRRSAAWRQLQFASAAAFGSRSLWRALLSDWRFLSALCQYNCPACRVSTSSVWAGPPVPSFPAPSWPLPPVLQVLQQGVHGAAAPDNRGAQGAGPRQRGGGGLSPCSQNGRPASWQAPRPGPASHVWTSSRVLHSQRTQGLEISSACQNHEHKRNPQ